MGTLDPRGFRALRCHILARGCKGRRPPRRRGTDRHWRQGRATIVTACLQILAREPCLARGKPAEYGQIGRFCREKALDDGWHRLCERVGSWARTREDSRSSSCWWWWRSSPSSLSSRSPCIATSSPAHGWRRRRPTHASWPAPSARSRRTWGRCPPSSEISRCPRPTSAVRSAGPSWPRIPCRRPGGPTATARAAPTATASRPRATTPPSLCPEAAPHPDRPAGSRALPSLRRRTKGAPRAAHLVPGQLDFARSIQPSPCRRAAQLELPRSRSAAALNVRSTSPRLVARPLGSNGHVRLGLRPPSGLVWLAIWPGTLRGHVACRQYSLEAHYPWRNSRALSAWTRMTSR